jgi:hypothetical protein
MSHNKSHCNLAKQVQLIESVPGRAFFNQFSHIQECHLWQHIEKECQQIFDSCKIQIPALYHKMLTSIQQQNFKSPSNLHFSTICEMHELLSVSSDEMDENEMKRALQYFHAIGRVVVLDDNTVCTDPTIIPKIAAEFISPTEVRNKLLLSKGKVEILSEGDIKCLLKIIDDNDPRFIFWFYIFMMCCFDSYFCFIYRLNNALLLMQRMGTCYKLPEQKSDKFFFLFPSLAQRTGMLF